MAEANFADVHLHAFDDDGVFPNNKLPAVIYRAALRPDMVSADAFEDLFSRNNWPPQWRWGVYPYHHYHSTAHEVLGVATGSARITLGGPNGKTFDVAAGDVIVIPAGVGHQRVSASDDFLVVGAYPPAQKWDLLKGDPGDRPQADRNIAAVSLPETDPVGGRYGPVLESWGGHAS